MLEAGVTVWELGLPENFTTSKKRPGSKESRDARTVLPQNCSSGKISQQAGERNATLEQLIGTKRATRWNPIPW